MLNSKSSFGSQVKLFVSFSSQKKKQQQMTNNFHHSDMHTTILLSFSVRPHDNLTISIFDHLFYIHTHTHSHPVYIIAFKRKKQHARIEETGEVKSVVRVVQLVEKNDKPMVKESHLAFRAYCVNGNEVHCRTRFQNIHHANEREHRPIQI